MSTGLPYGSFLNTSGDRYPGVPAKPANIEKYKHVIPIYSTQCDFWLLLLHYDRFHTSFCALCQRCVLNKLASWDDLNIQSSSLCATYSSRTVHKSWASSNFFIFSFQEDHPSCIFFKVDLSNSYPSSSLEMVFFFTHFQYILCIKAFPNSDSGRLSVIDWPSQNYRNSVRSSWQREWNKRQPAANSQRRALHVLQEAWTEKGK